MKNGMYFSKNLIDSRYSNKLTSSMQRYVGSVNVEKRRRKRKSDEVHGAETQRRGIRNAEPRSRSPVILSRVLSLMDETGLTLLAGIRRCPCSCIINNSLSLSLSLARLSFPSSHRDGGLWSRHNLSDPLEPWKRLGRMFNATTGDAWPLHDRGRSKV